MPRIVHDKFRVMQHAGNAVDEAGGAEFFRKRRDMRDVVKGKRWSLLSCWKNGAPTRGDPVSDAQLFEEAAIRNTLAGFPATMAPAGTFVVTTLPAPTMAFSPIVTFERIVAPDPIDAPFLISVGSTFQSSSVCNPPPGTVARG